MKANTVNETINFKRGQSSKEAVQIGEARKYTIARALLENPTEPFKESTLEWLNGMPKVAKMLKLEEDPELYGFDVEYFSEDIMDRLDEEVDFEELLEEESEQILDSVTEGEFTPIRYNLHLLKDGTKVIYYNGFTDGFITRRDWINK